MKSELEIARLLERDRERCQTAVNNQDWQSAAMLTAAIDVLKWVLGD